MTLQVAMVGKDGIVLASDKQMSRSEAGGPRQLFQTDKIRVGEGGHIATAFARNNLGMAVAAKIPSLLAAQEDPKRWRLVLETEAQSVFEQDSECIEPGHLLVISPRCLDGFYFVEVAKHSLCQEVKDKCITGDITNPAAFFVERYYDRRRQIAELAFLAAHAILCASGLNPAGIQGLDVLFCRNDGFTWATAEELDAYRKHSQQIEGLIDSAIWPCYSTRGESSKLRE